MAATSVPRSERGGERVVVDATEGLEDGPPIALRSAPRVGQGVRRSIKGLFLLAVLYTLYFAKPFLMPIVLALLFALVLRPMVRALTYGIKLKEPISAAIVMLSVLGILGVGATLLVDPAIGWLERAPATFREIDAKLSRWKRPLNTVKRATDQLDGLAHVDSKPGVGQVVVKSESLGSRLIDGTQEFAISALTVIILVYFLLASGDLFLLKVVRVINSLRDKIKAVEVARMVERDIGRYLLTLSAINTGLGTVTVAAMHFLGMPNPLLWGVMVAVFNFVPYVGAGVSTTVLTAVALISFSSVGHALMVPAVFLLLTTLEGQFVQPIVIGMHFSVNPVLVFSALLFWGWIWGVPGMLVAVPMLVIFKILCSHIASLAGLGEFLQR